MSRLWLALILSCPTLVSAQDSPTAEQSAFFETKIRPVLAERCLECHNSEDPENGLDLSSRAGMIRGGKLGPALKPGKPDQSLLISAIQHDEFIKMPPREKLPSNQVVDFTQWVKMGAPWPDSEPESADAGASAQGIMPFTSKQLEHWAWRPLSHVKVPHSGNAWAISPIDEFVLRQLQQHGLKPAPPADRRMLIRRATFDLTGLPPTPEETAAFVADDSPDAFAKVIDRLLASPRYGERWGRHWLDVARYADSNGLDENLSYANAFRYRDYVIRAMNNDKPYARFVQEQLAGDLLPAPEDDQDNIDRFIATGFLAIGPKMLAEDDPMKMQMDIIDEQLNTMGQTFMGLTVGCARCHDHKFDPIPTEDYYSLAGIFKSSKTMENHKVVAVWYERPLVSKAVSRRIEETDEEVSSTETAIAALKNAHRDRIAAHQQQNLAGYLLAAQEFDRIQSLPRQAAVPQSADPLVVTNGFLRIEAEHFHRGNVEKLSTGYGEGIGITGTRGAGFMEYDVRVDKPGWYQLEIRHAAAQSRPAKLVINGNIIEESVVGQVTGSWYPDGQRWFPAGRFELNEGVNTIRIDSAQVHPHIDRLLLVFDPGDAKWPFDVAAPQSMTSIAARHGVRLALVSEWSRLLKEIADGKHEQFVLFRGWLSLAEKPDEFFEQSAEVMLQQLPDLPEALQTLVREKPPRNITQTAQLFARLLDDEPARKELIAAPSPLAGPSDITPSSLPAADAAELTSLMQRVAQLKESRPKFDVAMGLTEGNPEDLKIHLRGSHIALGKVAPRRFLRVFSDRHRDPDSRAALLTSLAIPEKQSGRLQMAKWMTQTNHPLTWRVIVNRVWSWRFGRGLAPSVDNFGLLGEAPTHPELLDWLAVRFQGQGGSLKRLHRLMMLSNTYQMSTQYSQKAQKTDPQNKLLWRFRRRRLSGEEVRDSLVSLGTGLDLTMGGTVLKAANRSYVTSSGTTITNEYDNHRRSVYLPVVRSAVYDVLQTFDFPDPAVPAGQRQTSTVAPQALMMMNAGLVDQQTKALAEKLAGMSEDDRIRRAVELVLNRVASRADVASARDYLASARQVSSVAALPPEEARLRAFQSYCRVLFSLNEFAYVE